MLLFYPQHSLNTHFSTQGDTELACQNYASVFIQILIMNRPNLLLSLSMEKHY